MSKSTEGDVPRRRTFFTSTISINNQRPIESSSSSKKIPPSHAVLAALSPPIQPPTSSINTEKSMMHANKVDRAEASQLAKLKLAQNRIQKEKEREKEKGSEKKVSSATVTVKETVIGKEVVYPDRAAKARAARIANLAKKKEERATETTIPDEPRKTRRASMATSSSPAKTITPKSIAGSKHERQLTNNSTDLSDPPPLILKISKRAATASKSVTETVDQTPLKDYMEAGFYCQDDHAKSPYKLISKVLQRREAEERVKSRKADAIRVLSFDRPTFPPMPYDYGHKLFFDEEQDFVLPFNIRREAENGHLDKKKRPAAYSKLRANVFPERQRMLAGTRAVCHCDDESDCGDNCINRIMNYLCGRDCPCGEKCTNKSLAKRKGANVKVTYTGSRGFGLTAVDDIVEGDFVIDYRGEVISLDTFQERCTKEYAVSRNFYALAYDQDEVIDAGGRGNEARFINHSCNPNLAVYRFQSLGDGLEEYEVGMWASRDIAAGEELTYDYNFDSFGVSEGAARVECRCGAPNCVGYLGRKSGEKSAKQIALDIEAEKAARAKVAEIKAKRSVKSTSNAVTGKPPNAEAGPSSQRSFWRPRDPKSPASSDPPQSTTGQIFSGLTIGGHTIIAKIRDTITGTRRQGSEHETALPTPESMDSATFSIPPPVDFRSAPLTSQAGAKGTNNREPSPVPLFKIHKKAYKASKAVIQARVDGTISASDEDEDEEDGKGNSGWAQWLKRKAGERPRTLEDWQELRHARRRGQRWMERMMAEYGILPGPGVPGHTGLVVSQQLLDAKRLEAAQAGIDMTAPSLLPRMKKSTKRKPRQTDPGPSQNKKRKRTSTAGSDKPAVQPSDSLTDESDKETARAQAQREAIRKRNGAPRGWVYEPVTEPPANAVDTVQTDLAPRRRATISYKV